MTVLAGQVGSERDTARRPQPFLDRLQGLAQELSGRGLQTKMVSPIGRVPSLHVVNPRAFRMAEDVYVGRSQDGLWWFWWPWAERIAAANNLAEAADLIAKVLDVSE